MECSPVSNKLLNKATQLKTPVDGTFELTGDCIFNCKMCYVHNCGKRSLEMETVGAEKWEKLFSQCVDNGLLFCLLTGGEPLLHKEFDRIYTSLKSKNVIITVNTNGYLLNAQRLEFFKALPPQRFNISLYGVTDGTYEMLCGVKNGFSVVDKNIKEIRRCGINMRLNATITKTNRGEVFDIIRYADENGLHIRPTTYIFGTEQNAVDERLPAEEAAALTAEIFAKTHTPEQLKGMCADYEIKLEAGKKNKPRESSFPGIVCHAGKCAYWVHSDGKMSICGMLPADNAENVFEKDFLSVWTQAVKATEEIKSNPVCNACDYRYICRKCHGMTECEHVLPEEIESSYSCRYHKALADEFIRMGKNL